MVKDVSQYDPGLVLRDVHELKNNSLRVTSANTSVPVQYSRVELIYNVNNSVTNARFFEGTLAEKRNILFNPDIAGSLNNTYFSLYSENDESLYHIWYNVDGLGTDPSPVGSVGIEVEIQSNDPAQIVKLATEIALRNKEDFRIYELSPISICIENSRKGIATDTSDFGTGFEFLTVQQGQEELLKSIDIPYENNIRYIYNEQEKKFEVEVVGGVTVDVDIDADNGDNIAISRHEEYRNIVDEEDYLDTDLSINNYTQIWTYTATENLRLRALKIKADTLGNFKLIINGITKDYFLTSPTDRNCRFYFLEDEDLLDGQELQIEFLPERLRLTNYNFFFRIEAYVQE